MCLKELHLNLCLFVYEAALRSILKLKALFNFFIELDASSRELSPYSEGGSISMADLLVLTG